MVSSSPTIMQPPVWIPSTQSTLRLFQFLLLKLYLKLVWLKDENKLQRGRDWPIFYYTKNLDSLQLYSLNLWSQSIYSKIVHRNTGLVLNPLVILEFDFEAK